MPFVAAGVCSCRLLALAGGWRSPLALAASRCPGWRLVFGVWAVVPAGVCGGRLLVLDQEWRLASLLAVGSCFLRRWGGCLRQRWRRGPLGVAAGAAIVWRGPHPLAVGVGKRRLVAFAAGGCWRWRARDDRSRCRRRGSASVGSRWLLCCCGMTLAAGLGAGRLLAFTAGWRLPPTLPLACC